MSVWNKHVHWILLSTLFISQYILCFVIEESGTYVLCTINNNIQCGSYSDCIYFKYLFYYTRIIIPILHSIPILLWFYTSAIFGLEYFISNQTILTFCPLLTATISPYFSFSSSFDDQYFTKLTKRSIIIQSLYMIPSFIISLFILCADRCYSDKMGNDSTQLMSISCTLFLFLMLIHLIYYIDSLQYISFVNIIKKNVAALYHDYFISTSLIIELLMFVGSILISFFIDDHDYNDNNYKYHKYSNLGFNANIKPFIIYLFCIPLLFPYIYFKYYYKSLNSNKWSVLKRGLTQYKHNGESHIIRIYSFIHIVCHTLNSYDIIYKNVDCKSIPLMIASRKDHKNICINTTETNKCKIENDPFIKTKNGIIKHKDDIFLCLQYQTYFMKLELKDKINYISQIAPYQSNFFYSKHSIKCNNYYLIFFYIYLLIKIFGTIAPIFWFIFIYLYSINSNQIKQNGFNKWLFSNTNNNKYEHLVITILFTTYIIIYIIWLLFAVKIALNEYYYGFVRSLLINQDDEEDSNNNNALCVDVEEFHSKMIKSNEIVTLLESNNIITHIAIQIVSYLPHYN